MTKPPRQPDIEAEVSFISTAEGGRSTPALSGYQPIHQVLPDYLPSGRHWYKDKEQVLPGESAVAEIWFLTPDQYPKSLHVGKIIRIQEGSRLVGHAKVLKIFNGILQK
jgi:elongation factor Tu